MFKNFIIALIPALVAADVAVKSVVKAASEKKAAAAGA